MFIPMLNPDGAEAVTRFNAQGIDINRDWRRLGHAGGAGPAAGGRNAEAGVRLQPAQSKRPHERRSPAAAGRRLRLGTAARRDAHGIALDAIGQANVHVLRRGGAAVTPKA